MTLVLADPGGEPHKASPEKAPLNINETVQKVT
jgi:hypothetical protein